MVWRAHRHSVDLHCRGEVVERVMMSRIRVSSKLAVTEDHSGTALKDISYIYNISHDATAHRTTQQKINQTQILSRSVLKP